uniref:Dystrotelin n=1 Tax=Chelonoidis abingdonii TaxID=106734 RepID=A0A8C0QRG2_CHEAB
MDPDQQEALNDIQNSVYRTALKLHSVQTLCQLDLTDVSLIQHILPSHQCQREKQSSLTTQQLSQLLKELFQNSRLDKPGQVDPQAPELTQNLLTSMYDRTGTGFIKARSAAAALIALSGDGLHTKYKVIEPEIDILFQVLNSAISEEKFLSWLLSEPGLLLWLPTCYRLSATERVMHHVRCSICKNFPITGLRYRCLKCLNFDLCQVCFFTERQRKPHKRSHPVMEYCQMSAKENAKIFFRTIRNNLLQERCRRKEAWRRQTLEMEGGDFPEHEQAAYLRKQLNKWKDEVLLLHKSQEDKSCRLEAKLQVLIANHECVQAELQQMRQEIKVMLQPPNHPSFVLCQNMMSKSKDPWEERKLHNGSHSALAKPIPTSYTEWKSLDPSSAAEKQQLLQTQSDPVAMNLRSSGTTSGSIFLQNGNPLMRQHEKSKKGIPQTDLEGISQPERSRNLPQEIMTTASSPTGGEVPFNEKEVNEEKELQQLVLKLKDALSLQLQPGKSSKVTDIGPD